MNKLRYTIIGLLCLLLLLGGAANVHSQEDSLSYHPVQGKVVDDRTDNPIIFANIYLAGTNIGTVSNSDGEFIVKIPLFIENKISDMPKIMSPSKKAKDFSSRIRQLFSIKG